MLKEKINYASKLKRNIATMKRADGLETPPPILIEKV